MDRQSAEDKPRQKYYMLDKKGRKCYSNGPGKPPIFVQAILDEQKISADVFFHITDAFLDWQQQGDDLAVLEPLIALLAKWGDDMIFAFDDAMAELLYTLDTRQVAQGAYKGENFSADDFLYARCVALVNSKTYYNGIIRGVRKLNRDMEFEAILYVPALAWARLHQQEPTAYPHSTPFCYETMSNASAWRELTPIDLADFMEQKAKQRLEVSPMFCECGCAEFRVQMDKGKGAIKLICADCGLEQLLVDSADFWETCRPRRRMCGNCRQEIFNVSLGVACWPNGFPRDIYVGALCLHCENMSILLSRKFK